MPYALLAGLLAALSTVGPFAIDTYLPALPAIGREFGASPAQVQHTLDAYMLPLGLMVMWHGAFSDAWGRKPVIVVSMLLFALASLVCVLAPSLDVLLLGRALQGIAGGAGMVVGRAVVRDLFEGARAQKLMSHVSMTFALGPAIAPILGGWIFRLWGWRAVFVFLALLGLALALACAWKLPESLPPAARQPLHPDYLLKTSGRILRTPLFLLLTLAVGCNFNGYFIYVLSAPHVLMDLLGLPETGFGYFFIPTVGGMMLGSACSGRLAGRLSGKRTIALGLGIMALAAAINLLVSHTLPPGILATVLPVCLYTFGMSIAMPSLTLLALELFPAQRGLASSCQSLLQMMVSASSAGLIAPLLWSSVGHMALGMAVALGLGALCFALARRLPHPGTPT